MAVNDRVLRAVARILPREFRERVFEPALADLTLDEGCPASSRQRGRLARLVLAAECLRLGLPQFVWHKRRPTRLGAALFAAIVVTAFVIQRINYSRLPTRP